MATDAQESPEEKIAFDMGFDMGWEAGQNALKEGFLAQSQEVRLEGFQNGFAAGFKEGRVTGKNEASLYVTTYPAPNVSIPVNAIDRMIAGTGCSGCPTCADLYPHS